MDHQEISEIPEFEHDIDPYTHKKIPEEFRDLAETISKLRQEVRWVGAKVIIAHNLSVQTAKLLQRAIYAVLGTVGLFVLTKLLEMISHKGS